MAARARVGTKPGCGELRVDAVAMCRVCYGKRRWALLPESVRRRLALKVRSRLDGAN